MEKSHWYTEDQLRSQHMIVHDLLVQRLALISNQDITLQTPTSTSSSSIIPFPIMNSSVSTSTLSTSLLLDEDVTYNHK